MVPVALVSAGLGLWALLTGRSGREWPPWPLDGRAYRLAGAYSLMVSLLVIALALTHHEGIAFLTYAILTLALVVTVQVVSRRKPAV